MNDGRADLVDGLDVLRKPAKVRQVIGLAGQFAAVEEAMTGRENLEMVARLFGLGRKTAKSLFKNLTLTIEDCDLVRDTTSGA